MTKFIIRLAPFVLHFYAFIVTFCAWSGIDLCNSEYLFGYGAFMALILLCLVYEQGKYHCVYVRAMLWYALALSIMNFLFDRPVLFDKYGSIVVAIMQSLWVATTLITAYLAIEHFIKINKTKEALWKSDLTENGKNQSTP